MSWVHMLWVGSTGLCKYDIDCWLLCCTVIYLHQFIYFVYINNDGLLQQDNALLLGSSCPTLVWEAFSKLFIKCGGEVCLPTSFFIYKYQWAIKDGMSQHHPRGFLNTCEINATFCCTCTSYSGTLWSNLNPKIKMWHTTHDRMATISYSYQQWPHFYKSHPV